MTSFKCSLCQTNIEEVHGDIMKTRAWDGERFRDDHFVDANGYVYQSWCLNSGHFTLSRVDWKLSRFTGLYDKNKKEIYEGDIVIMWYDLIERWSAPLLVTFDVLVIEDDFGATREPMCWRVGDSELSGICEIVGNIHENPELLEEVTK